jgi:hypothetical protein
MFEGVSGMVRCQLKEPVMNISFGIYATPPSTLWKDIRKGPPLDAVREHLDRVVNFRRLSEIARKAELR